MYTEYFRRKREKSETELIKACVFLDKVCYRVFQKVGKGKERKLIKTCGFPDHICIQSVSEGREKKMKQN